MQVGIQNLTSIVRNMNDKIEVVYFITSCCVYFYLKQLFARTELCVKNRKKEVLLLPCWKGYHKLQFIAKGLGEFSGKEQTYKELRLV